jgi:hypothetical protein
VVAITRTGVTPPTAALAPWVLKSAVRHDGELMGHGTGGPYDFKLLGQVSITHTHTHIHTHDSHTQNNIHMHTHAHTHTRIYIRTQMRAQHTYTHTHTHALTRTCTLDTHARTRSRIHNDTYTHSCNIQLLYLLNIPADRHNGCGASFCLWPPKPFTL